MCRSVVGCFCLSQNKLVCLIAAEELSWPINYFSHLSACLYRSPFTLLFSHSYNFSKYCLSDSPSSLQWLNVMPQLSVTRTNNVLTGSFWRSCWFFAHMSILSIYSSFHYKIWTKCDSLAKRPGFNTCLRTVWLHHRDLSFTAGFDSMLNLCWTSCFLKLHRFHSQKLPNCGGGKPAREKSDVTPGMKAAQVEWNEQM